MREASSTARRASRTAKKYGEIGRADKQLDELLEERSELEAECQAELARIKTDYDNPPIEPYKVAPRKSDITVERIALAWVG
jgi:hypothetical protein